VLVCATALALAGCGREDEAQTKGAAAAEPAAATPGEKTVETEVGAVTLKRDGDGVNVEARGGQLHGHFGAGAALPESFPKDVHLPEDARVMGSMTSTEPGANGSMVSLQSDRPAAELLDELRNEIVRDGWSVDEETSTMGWQVIRASKGDRKMIVQTIDRDGGSHAMVHLDR
jgi:hypothetical protein